VKRRSVVSLTGGLALGLALPALAQPQRVLRLGVLGNVPALPVSTWPVTWFRDELKRLGWEVGQTISFEFRYAMNDPQRYHAFAAELAAAKLDVIYAPGDDALEAASKATKTIPIVTIAAAVVELGYAKSLARPGGNVTGVVFQPLDFVGKSFGILRALRPDLKRVGISHRPGHPLSDVWVKTWQTVAGGQGATMVALPFVRNLAELEPMLAIAKREGVQALVGEGPVPILLGSSFETIRSWATENKVLTYGTTWVRGEHLVSFGPDPWEIRRIAIAQIDRILRGAKPAEMPIEQPTKFELIVNRKIAKAMGLTIPQTVLLQANEVID
jgi:putative tryptophan/tyrosine transport system substrate-binding protein